MSNRRLGIRLPRTTGKGLVIGFLNSAAGQVLLAEAIVLAAGVFGARRRRSSATTRVAQERRVTIKEAKARLSYACLEAMKAFRAALAESDPVVAHVVAESEPVQGKRVALPGPKRRRRRTKRSG